jgi:YD repeat-containing protein
VIRRDRKRWRWGKGYGFSLFVLFAFLVTSSEAGQSRFVYDEFGRLAAEVDDQGNAAVYTYDAVGNLLSISRSDAAPTGISITLFSPQHGPEGEEVTIFGSGFSAVPTDNQVAFNGTTAQVVSSTATQIVARVPIGATTGPIAVTNLNGTATTSTSFTVTAPASVEVSPVTVTVVAGTSTQFEAIVSGLSNQAVLWSLEGVGTSIGSLSDTGLYSVPASFTDTARVLVKATSLGDVTKSGTATVTVLPAGLVGPIHAPQVSVVIQQSDTPAGPFIAPQVSAVIGETDAPSGPFVGSQVSVAIGQNDAPSGPFVTPQVSVSLIPIIQTISPSNGVQGVTNLPVTLTGTGLAGATSFTFFLNGAVDTTVTASAIMANPEGTQVTVELTVAPGAPLGPRVVRISTSSGTSPAAMLEGNTFSVASP